MFCKIAVDKAQIYENTKLRTKLNIGELKKDDIVFCFIKNFKRHRAIKILCKFGVVFILSENIVLNNDWHQF